MEWRTSLRVRMTLGGVRDSGVDSPAFHQPVISIHIDIRIDIRIGIRPLGFPSFPRPASTTSFKLAGRASRCLGKPNHPSVCLRVTGFLLAKLRLVTGDMSANLEKARIV